MEEAPAVLKQGPLSLAYFGSLSDRVDESWWPLFNRDTVIRELEDIAKKLKAREELDEVIFPMKDKMFRVFLVTPLDSVRAVIMGQDPYANGHATGIAFSGGGKNANTVPASLKNIVKEVQRCYPKRTIPDLVDPSLEGWCAQGVLLLNHCLSVTEHQEGGHKGLWMGFITEVIDIIVKKDSVIPWLLWGSRVRRCQDLIQKRGGTNILICGHPSPRSVSFFQENGHFLEVDRIMLENGWDEIAWWRFNSSCDEE